MEKIRLVGQGYSKDSEKDLNLMFDYYNEVLFDNKIVKHSVKWNNRLTRILGRITYSKKLIELSYKYHEINDYKEMNNTLIHEMIHAYLYQTSNTRGHGRAFKNMCDIMNKKTGLNIKTTDGEENAKKLKTNKTRYTNKCKKCNHVSHSYKDVTTRYICKCGGELEIIDKEKVMA